ncbi:MAG: SulP family inorganic anion transporter [Bacteroidetes bacterium]|nr:SulP family inorganic anion transporter [Bacteroidota bacterium]
MKSFFKTWKQDLPAGLVVFLVALPLCLGVGLASTTISGTHLVEGVPNIFSGIVAGILGGIVVGIFSGSRLGVSGPAAGLITIVLGALVSLGSFEAFLVAVVLAGILQVIAGYAKLGILGNYFPSSVIKGMLAAIGITLILKEIPHAVGYDKDFFGDQSFLQRDGHNTFSELFYALKSLQPGAIAISVISIFLLVLLEQSFFKKMSIFNLLPGALIVVLFGIGINSAFPYFLPEFTLNSTHLVSLPVASTLKEFTSFFTLPDFTALKNIEVYKVAGTIALVASLETLLSVEATDKLDTHKRQTPTNKELKAQGFGNIFSGLIGGLPITQVIVRSSANINANAQSKLSTIFHGILLLVTVLFIPKLLNLIPLASLAAILFVIGYKLAKISIFKHLYKVGLDQFIPFVATILGVLFTDLLSGIGIGLVFSIFYILKRNFKNNYSVQNKEIDGELSCTILLSEEVTFLNKASIIQKLNEIPNDSELIIDGTNCSKIDFDVKEAISEFVNFVAVDKNINVKIINIRLGK